MKRKERKIEKKGQFGKKIVWGKIQTPWAICAKVIVVDIQTKLDGKTRRVYQ